MLRALHPSTFSPPLAMWAHRPSRSTWGEGWSHKTCRVQPVSDLSPQPSALGTAHTCPGNSLAALPARSCADLRQVLALSTPMPHRDIFMKLCFQTPAMQPVDSLPDVLCYRFKMRAVSKGVPSDQHPQCLLPCGSLQRSAFP